MKFPSPQTYRVSVLEVHDGDTIKVKLDKGFEDYSHVWLRLENVYAPELKQTGGVETRGFVSMWLDANNDMSDFPFNVIVSRQKNDIGEAKTFERYVAKVVSARGDVLNDAVNAFVEENKYPLGVGSKKKDAST